MPLCGKRMVSIDKVSKTWVKIATIEYTAIYFHVKGVRYLHRKRQLCSLCNLSRNCHERAGYLIRCQLDWDAKIVSRLLQGFWGLWESGALYRGQCGTIQNAKP